MVWIHGGAFKFGDGSEMIYGPDYLLANDVVYVSLNYRLGVLGKCIKHSPKKRVDLILLSLLFRKGFLSVDDPSVNVPGNAGLKDQRMALKWVRENVHHFGGNSKKLETFQVKHRK